MISRLKAAATSASVLRSRLTRWAAAKVIGRRLFLYDVWGDAVNVACRMESHGVAGRVQVSESTRRLLDNPFLVEERGTLEVDGVGELKTWFLAGRNSAN